METNVDGLVTLRRCCPSPYDLGVGDQPFGALVDVVAGSGLPLKALLFLAVGVVSILSAALILIFRVPLTRSIARALHETQGIPFRGRAIRNQNPNSMILVSVIAFFIGMVLLLNAAVRLPQYPDVYPEQAGFVWLVLGIAVGLCAAGAVLFRKGLRHGRTDGAVDLDAPHHAPGPASFIVLVVALILLGTTLVLIVLVES